MKTLKFKDYKNLTERQFYTRQDWDEVLKTDDPYFEFKEQFYSSYRNKIQVTKNGNDYFVIIDDPNLVIDWKWLFTGSKVGRFPVQFDKIRCGEIRIQEENFNSFLNFPKELIVDSMYIQRTSIQNFEHFSPKYTIKELLVQDSPYLKSLKGLPVPTENLRIASNPRLISFAGLTVPSKKLSIEHPTTWPRPSLLLSDYILDSNKCDDVTKNITLFKVDDKSSWELLLKLILTLSIDDIQFHYSYLEDVFDVNSLDILDYCFELLDIPIEKIRQNPKITKLRTDKKTAENDIGFSF